MRSQSRRRPDDLRQSRLLRLGPEEDAEGPEKDPKYQYNLGLFHLNQNNSDEAIKCFVKALALDARFFQAWNMMRAGPRVKGTPRGGREGLSKEPGDQSQFTEVHNNLGTVYQEMGQLDKAETAYKAALGDPTYLNRESPLITWPGCTSFRTGSTKLSRTSKVDPIQAPLRHGPRPPGVIQEKLGNLPEAIASYEAAVKIVPRRSLSATVSPSLISSRELCQGQADLPQDLGPSDGRGIQRRDRQLPQADPRQRGARPRLKRVPLRSLPASRQDTSFARA